MCLGLKAKMPTSVITSVLRKEEITVKKFGDVLGEWVKTRCNLNFAVLFYFSLKIVAKKFRSF